MDSIDIQNTEDIEKSMKKYYTDSSLRMIVVWLGWIVAQIFFSVAMVIAESRFSGMSKYENEISLVITLLVDIMLFGLLSLTMKNKEKSIPERKTLSFGKWLLIFVCGYAIVSLFNIIGIYVNGVILAPFGYNISDYNESYDIIMSIANARGLIMELIFFGFLAPIFEELIFRKTVIDNFSKYGMGAAILVSGLLFGLFHGNFSQFFSAFAFGILLAYVYSLTGNIKYTIAMHVSLNVYNIIIGLVPVIITDEQFEAKMTEAVLEFQNTQDMDAYMATFNNLIATEPDKFACSMISLAMNGLSVLFIFVAFIVLLFNIRKFIRFKKTLNMGVKGSKTHATLNMGMALGYVCIGFIFLIYYGAQILNSPVVMKWLTG